MEQLDKFEKCIERVRWRYSKTYPRAPHEYTVFDWAGQEDRKILREIARYIVTDGATIMFWGHPYKNLLLGEYKYWIMEKNPEETVLINRTYRDDGVVTQIREYVNSDQFSYKNDMCLNDIYREMINAK